MLAELRRRYVTKPIFAWARANLPPISATEREALDAGDVWWDAELFSGNPDWRLLERLPAPKLSEAESAFLAGPVEELCAQLDDWSITAQWHDLPPVVWDLLKKQRFFGMIIPPEYGGLGF